MEIIPDFLEADGDKIVAERVRLYETLTGRTLQPAQVERFIIQAGAYRELLIRQSINSALKQNFVETASAPILDFLGQLVGVTRLAAAYAETTLRFSLQPSHTGVIIPAGTRVQSQDGKATFATLAAVIVPAGQALADTKAIVDVPGEIGNGYAIGAVSEILDPRPFVTSAANLSMTSGGAEMESDEALRIRIKLAPNSFSNAGSRGAYIYFAKSANPLITDVQITNPIPGSVQLFPLVAGGDVTPQSVLDDVFAACNDEKVRPLTDTVIVTAPTRLTYTVSVSVTTYTETDPAAIAAAVEASIRAYANDRAAQLGRDVKFAQLLSRCMVAGVYDAQLLNFADVIVPATSFAVCSAITVTIVGTNVG
jgi:phage-related baseplate assembly protein